MQRKFLLPFLFVFVFFCSQGVVLAEETQNQTLQTLSQEIHTQLENLKQQSRHLTEQLAIAERIANILKTSRGIADGIERIEYLFGKYESEVKRLLSEIDRIRIEAENTSENNNVGSSTSNFRGDSPGDSFSAEN